MTRLEMVEQIREKTGVTYDTAKQALEESDWDMLDAIIALEKPDFTAAREIGQNEDTVPEKKNSRKASETISDLGAKVIYCIKFVLRTITKGEGVRMEIYRKDELIESISLTALVLLVLLKWWVPVGLIVIGMFTGFRFRFTGAGHWVNAIAEKTGEKAEEIKNKFSE